MRFDSVQALGKHRLKFCVGSKYGQLDSLTQELSLLQPSLPSPKRDRPWAGKSTLQAGSAEGDLEREYSQLLRQIGDREDLRARWERDREAAQEELQGLERKEQDLLLGARRKDLQELLRRREEMAAQEDQLQREIRGFELAGQKQAQQQGETGEDYEFREGREAGKLAMQRRLLEEKRRDIEGQLKAKKKEEGRVLRQIETIDDRPVFVPDYQRKAQSTVGQQGQQRPAVKPLVDVQGPQKVETVAQKVQVVPPKQSSMALRGLDVVTPPRVEAGGQRVQTEGQQGGQRVEGGRWVAQGGQSLLRASLFGGGQRTLFQSLNPKGKSDEDIFLQSLLAQEFDALNVLARLPRDGELYGVKLRQYQEMSRVRQELSQKVQRVRLQKVRREFELEKKLTETEKTNLKWLDENRRHMLGREVDVLHRQAQRQKEDLLPQDPLPDQNQPQLPRETAVQSTTRLPRLPSLGELGEEQGRGYGLLVKGVRGYEGESAICVRLWVLEEGEQPRWEFTTKYHDPSAPSDDRNPYQPGVRNRREEGGLVVFNASFEIAEDLQARHNRTQSELYLWAALMEKQSGRSAEPRIYLWYCLKLTHFGQLREGSFTLPLYHGACPMPEVVDMNRVKGRANEELLLELADAPLAAKGRDQPGAGSGLHRPNDNSPTNPNVTGFVRPNQTSFSRPGDTGFNRPNETNYSRPANTALSKGNGTRQSRAGPKVLLRGEQRANRLKGVREVFFMEREVEEELKEVREGEEVALEIGVAGLRTLPSHVGPVRLQVGLWDGEGQALLQSEEVMAELGEDMANPRVDYVRRAKGVQVPCGSLLVVQIVALGTLDYRPGLLGYAYLPLTFDRQGNALSEGGGTYLLGRGYFQLPIRWGRPGAPQRLQECPVIPCASLLVWVGVGQSLPPREYASGEYNTAFKRMDELQYRLFRQQGGREKVETNDYVEGYLKFKGVDAVVGREQVDKLLGQALAFNRENLEGRLMLRGMADYSPSFGLEFAVDWIQVAPEDAQHYYFSTACLVPPGAYYSGGRCDLDFFYRLDLASSQTGSLRLLHGPIHYAPQAKGVVCLVIELHRVRIEKEGMGSAVETCGFTVLPLFQSGSGVVAVGCRDLELVEGEFGERENRSFRSNPGRYVELMEGQRKSKFVLRCRLMNGFFPDQLGPQGAEGEGKPLRGLFQNSKGFRSATEAVIRVIEDTFGTKLGT